MTASSFPPTPSPRPSAEGPMFPKSGSVVIGKTGALVVPHGGAGIPTLYRDGKLSEENETLEKVENGNHFANWIEAVLAGGTGEAPISNFSYSGPMTENVLLGTVAQRLPGEKLEWDAEDRQVHQQQGRQCPPP